MMKLTTSETSKSSKARDPSQWARESTVYDCDLLDLPKIHNRTGNITVMEPGFTCPFEIKRVYYLYDIPGGASRGGHAHLELEQIILAASGSFDVLIDDGTNRRTLTLNQPYHALHIVPGIWRELHNFSSGSISLVVASKPYDESDYVRNYEGFRAMKLTQNVQP